MISMQELLTYGAKLEELSPEIQANLQELLKRVNVVRAAYGKPMTVTSGIRTMKEHLRIYAEKGITDQSKIPMKSSHLKGAAVDISDPQLNLTKWLKANPQILENANLYCEDGNSNWVHFQSKPFGSYKAGGTRWFKI